MSFSQENGYIPMTIEAIMLDLMAKINTQFNTSYTYETFVGTNFYKLFYALAQRMQENEIKTAEIFLRLQQYFDEINEMISRPVNTQPGIIEKMEDEGYIVSVKPMIEADAGKINIAVDVDETADDYAATKLAINTLISQITVAGAVTQGTEVTTIVLTNGQSFDFKYHLPNRIPVKIRLTTTLSENNQLVIGNPTETRQKLFNQIKARYRLGKNFEPQRYFNQTDAPWSSQVLVEWSTDSGTTYSSAVYDSDFDDLFTFGIGDVTLVEN